LLVISDLILRADVNSATVARYFGNKMSKDGEQAPVEQVTEGKYVYCIIETN
jgi:hypothetical protein